MFPDETSFPELSILCARCSSDVAVPPGLNALDAAWMHEHDCPAFEAEIEVL